MRVLVGFERWSHLPSDSWLTGLIGWVVGYHVYCIIDDGTNFMLVDSRRSMCVARTIPDLFVDALIASADKMIVVNEPNPSKDYPMLVPYSCVELTKRLTGVYGGFVLTPMQLFRKLVANGHKVAFDRGA